MKKGKSLDNNVFLTKSKITLPKRANSDNMIETKANKLASLEHMINLINNLNKVKKSHGKKILPKRANSDNMITF